MSIMKQKIQFGEQTSVIFQCNCGEDTYLNVERFDWREGEFDYHVSVSNQPGLLSDRLKTAWRALRGQRHAVSSHVLLSPEQFEDLLTELQQEVLAKKANEQAVPDI